MTTTTSETKSPFRERVAALSSALADSEKKVVSADRCFPTTLVLGAAIPLVVLILLSVAKPKIVTREDGGEVRRDKKKLFFWTLGISVILWAAMFGYQYYFKGLNNASMVCAT